MTAACGGGTSAPTIGSAAIVEYAAGLIAAIFAAYDLKWLIPTIPLVGLAPLTLSTFCASDPPAVPTFTQAEVNALLQLTPGADFASGLSKLKDWMLNAIWYDTCYCTSGTRVPLVPPAQPGGSITVVQPSPIAAACQHDQSTVLTLTSGQSFSRGGGSGFRLRNATACRFTLIDTQNAAPGLQVTWALNWEQTYPSFSVLHTDTYVLNPTQTMVLDLPVWAGSDEVTIHVTAAAGAGSTDTSFTIDQYCGGAMPGAKLQPCCPPDVSTAATLNAILDLVRSMQRQAVPFGYVKSTVHSGLTGTGTFAVSRLLGLEMQVTAFPATKRQLSGNPNYVMDLGWLSVSEVDGMIQEKRVAQANYVWLPPAMQLADHINYFLQPGVTATITEIQPEPY
jgi:hypothetical protein